MPEDGHAVSAQDLQAYANQSLPAGRAEVVHLHVAQCEACAQDVAAWVAVRQAVRPDVEHDAARRERVLSAVFARTRESGGDPAWADGGAPQPPAEGRHSGTPSRPWYNRMLPRAAAAVVVVITAVLAVLPSAEPAYADLLTRAATNLERARTARFVMEGTAQIAMGASEADDAQDRTLDFMITGQGEIQVPDHLQVRFDVVPAGLPPGMRAGAQRGETIRVGDTAYSRVDGGEWSHENHDEGVLAGSLLASDLPAILRAADGRPQDLGVEEITGVRTRHLAFAVADDAVVQPAGFNLRRRAHVWIDEHDRLIRLRMEAEGPVAAQPLPGYWRIGLTLTLADFGAAVDIRPPLSGPVEASSAEAGR